MLRRAASYKANHTTRSGKSSGLRSQLAPKSDEVDLTAPGHGLESTSPRAKDLGLLILFSSCSSMSRASAYQDRRHQNTGIRTTFSLINEHNFYLIA